MADDINKKISIDIEVRNNGQQQIDQYSAAFTDLRSTINGLGKPLNDLANSVSTLGNDLSKVAN